MAIAEFLYGLPSQFPYGLQLYIAGLIFSLPQKKRSRPVLRFAAAGTVILTAAWFCPDYRIFGFIFLPFIVLTPLTALAFVFILDVDFKTVIFCVICMGLLQHTAETGAYILRAAVGCDEGDVVWIICSFVSYMIVYPIGWFVMARRMKNMDSMSIRPWKMLSVAAGVIVLVYFMREITTLVLPEEIRLNRFVFFCNNLYPMLCCVLAFIILFSLNRSDTLALERTLTREMLRKEQDRYAMLTANIDAINRKCHDLKHQIKFLRDGEAESDRKEYILNLEKDVMIYEKMPKTGNAAFDNTLYEKNLVCDKNDVKFSYLADSAKLNFMEPTDIYSLFGNALDNAIEHVLAYDDPEKRIISLSVGGTGNIVRIHIENYCEHRLNIVDNDIETSKADKTTHGFGLRSMRFIVEKYGGYFALSQTGKLFSLDMVFSAPEGSDGRGKLQNSHN